MKELVLDAQKTGDGTDARKVLVAANEMGAIATVDFARWERELATLDAAKSFDKSGGWPSKPDLPVGFHAMTTKAGEGEKFVNFALGSGKGKCDEVVSFPKDGDGKGNKTLVSAHSGYAVELVGVVDGTEKNLMAKESGLRGNLEKMRADMETLAKGRGECAGIF